MEVCGFRGLPYVCSMIDAREITEWAGLLTGLAGVWLTIRASIWCFPVGLINVSLSAWIFYGQNLYADVLQQAVYFILLVYGWKTWGHAVDSRHRLRIGRMNIRQMFIASGLIAAGTALLSSLLITYTDAHYPLTDSLATCMAFTAQYLIARKKIENWLLWLVVNVIYIGLYTLKGLHLYALLYGLYLALAVYGYLQWRLEMQRKSIS